MTHNIQKGTIMGIYLIWRRMDNKISASTTIGNITYTYTIIKNGRDITLNIEHSGMKNIFTGTFSRVDVARRHAEIHCEHVINQA